MLNCEANSVNLLSKKIPQIPEKPQRSQRLMAEPILVDLCREVAINVSFYNTSKIPLGRFPFQQFYY